ncbi:hypothetical protein N0V90_013423 [Kalmusia sp. IMI 367209]|nr:hypothetical protein N0V90_013423 [Kalmusia sp. IMI 367209]
MTDVGGDCFAGLTTAPIFDDALYLAQALLLPPSENEEDLETKLTAAARESGIEDPDLFLVIPDVVDISTSLSTMSLQSEQRSSMSIHSRETQSTAFTSLPSRTSRDNPDQSPISRMPPPLVRASLSLDRNDAVPDSPRSEVDLVTENFSSSPHAASLRDSGYSENGMSSIDLPHALDTHTPVMESSTVLATPSYGTNEEEEARLSVALASEAFQKLKVEQSEQLERVSVFEGSQRKALFAHFQCLLERLAVQLEHSKTEKTKQHVQQLERLDEFQLGMEHDLRTAHATETQNVATALKYMEAYCSGPNPTNPEITYIVTDEDRSKLERQRIIQTKLPAKHASAINVLRARQERDIQVRLQKQQTELQQLDVDHDKEKRTQELQYVKDTGQLDAVIQTRRSRIDRRWNLRFEIWRKEWEKETGVPLNGPLPHADWPETTDPEYAPVVRVL